MDEIDMPDAAFFTSMWDTMYPTATFRQPTGEACSIEECPCNGQGVEVRVIVVESANN